MVQRTGIDWAVIRLQYELLHEDVDDLAIENGTSRAAINHAIKNQSWARMPIGDFMKEFGQVSDVDELTDDLIEEVRKRVSVLNVLKRAALNPRYIALESAILGKALEITASITATSPNASAQLKNVVGAYITLQGGGGKTGKDNDQSDEPLRINILNVAGGSEEQATQITTK